MELDLELDVIEHEPTVLEYARFHGLCRDYTQELPQFDPNLSLSEEALDLDLQDPKNVPALTNHTDELMKERLAVSKEAAMLLKTVHSLQEAPPDLLVIVNGRHRIRNLKQEVPVLRTDNELDMLQFGSAVEPSFTDLKIPLEPIDEESDEGLEWPSKYSAFPQQCMERAQNEKLGVSKETLLYIQDAIRDFYLPEDSEMVKEETLNYRKSTAVRPVTPPLLPLTPPLTPYIPSSPVNHLQFISDDSNSTAAEAKALEERIMNADALVQDDSNGSDILLMDMLDDSEYETSLSDANSPRVKRKASDLKIEGPLTPQMFSESPAKKLKTVTFAEMLVEYIPVLPWIDEGGNRPDKASSHMREDDRDLPSNFENGNDILTEEDDYAFFKDIIESAAEDANWRVENEKLSEADTTRRMDVPHVNFRLPTAPWDEYTCNDARNTFETELDAQARFLQWVKRNHMRSATSWHGISGLERTLPLAPFPHESAKVTIEEKLHDENVLNKTLSEITRGEIATSATDLWKRDGLRLLEDDEQEDDTLEPAKLDERMGMDSLIRKRKLELQDNVDDQKSVHRVEASTSTIVKKRPHPQHEVRESHHWKGMSPAMRRNTTPCATESWRRDFGSMAVRGKRTQPQERDTCLMFGGMFSATSALDNFMALHGMTAKPKAVGKEEPAPNRPPAPPLPSLTCPAKQARDDSNDVPKTGVRPAPEAVRQPPALPPLPEDMPPCSFVISSVLLQRRSLSRQIERLYSAAEFVGRDFDSHHIVSREADLILSPSTGLILTTLQQLKQRALPGQPDRSPIKERMLALQYVYERLVVLVSEGLSREREEQASAGCLDHRDQEAIAEYEKLTSQLDGEVLVRYVPGGEQALARAIVGEMAQFGLPHGSKDIGDIKLLPDQTTWELFLRRAGLNVFAAQVMLALLKDPVDWPHPSYNMSDMPSDTIQTCGLQTFLFMSAEQRLQNFQAVLGGSRVLNRVSALLDEPWLSAVHGFRI